MPYVARSNIFYATRVVHIVLYWCTNAIINIQSNKKIKPIKLDLQSSNISLNRLLITSIDGIKGKIQKCFKHFQVCNLNLFKVSLV